ncbi:MAG: hypothetical protein ABIT71_09295 [Vicinamibacteraceae bacterium]
MSNNVQSHETAAEQMAGEERRASARLAARSLGSITARIIGGSQVDLVNFSNRGVLFECDSRLLIGARASVRITTPDANLIVTGRVVRSRVKGLVNGALRYDAALVLDTELGLAPAAAFAELAPAGADDMVSFESDFDASFEPSPVDAYLAESEASLLDVASSTELTLHATPAPEAIAASPEPSMATEPVALDAEPIALDPEPVALDTDLMAYQPEPVAFEPEPVAFESEPVAFESEPVAFETEPVAFEPDAEIAFEPAVEFAFDEAAAAFEEHLDPFVDAVASTVAGASTDPAEPLAVAAVEQIVADEPLTVFAVEPVVASMFDATYIPPAHETVSGESQFEVTPPTPVAYGAASSFFDPHPSEAYGDRAIGPAADVVEVEADAFIETIVDAATIEPDAGPVVETADVTEFESAVAFEAEDAVMFEAAFDDVPVDAPIDVAVDLVVALSPVVEDLPMSDALEASAEAIVADGIIEPPAAVADTEDRVLLQFAATVPHDLADLRRIAADNQW